LTYGPAFRELLHTLTGPEVRQAFADKFQIDLTRRPTMVTVRGLCGPRDGAIHTDAVTKLITVLIYMNPHWEQSGGRLRLLRSATSLEDTLIEVPPEEGTLIAFRRSDNSFHGHKPFTGPRRVIQLNWVTDRWTVQREILRHRVSAWMKRMLGRRAKVAPSPW
jgi:SM-20-related protein